MLSHAPQLWIDRNFPLDYGLKSVMKLCHRETCESVSQLREVLKHRAYNLLGQMLAITTGDLALYDGGAASPVPLAVLAARWTSDPGEHARTELLLGLLESNYHVLLKEFADGFARLSPQFSHDARDIIGRIRAAWERPVEWKLINNY
jgi:hypothetical protein